MAAATGTVVVASAGGSFDSATYPRFVLSDGTNSLTFVIDNTARGLIDTDGNTAVDGDYTSPGITYPLEDPSAGRLVIPTLDEADGAQKSILTWIPTDYATLSSAMLSIDANDTGNSGLTAISGRAHYVLRDADGNSIKIGFGEASGTSLTNHGSVLIAQYATSGSPRYIVYRETSSSSNYFVRVVAGGSNKTKLVSAFYGAFKHAYSQGLINIDAYGISGSGALSQPSVASNTYVSSGAGIKFEYTTAGYKGNACSLELKDPAGSFSTDAEKKAVSWGYDEYSATNSMYWNRHSTTPTDDQWFANNQDTKIYFRQGTIAGSGSDAALSAENIAEAIKDIINGSVLGITATRSSGTVNLTNDTDGDGGNVTITTTNAGSLFSVTGMSNAGGEEEGGDEVAKTFINNKQIKITSALLPASAGAVDLGSTSAEWSDMYMTDGSAIKFGADQGVSLTHVSGSGVRLNDAWKLQFRSAGVEVYSSAADQLDIDATTVQIAGTTLDVDAAADISGALNLQSTLTVAGALDLNAAADISGATSLAASGVLTDIRGTLSVDEAATFDAGVTIGGALDLNAAADISGATSLAASGVLTDIRGTLSVDEAATFDAGVTITGAIDANSTSDFQGAMNLQAGITVAGAADYNGAMDVAGATSLAASGVLTDIRGTLSVDEAATFDAGVTITGAIDANSTSDFQGAMNLQAGITVAGAADLNGSLDVAGAVALGASGGSADTSVRGDLSVGENLTVTGNMTVNGTTTTVDSTTVAVGDTLLELAKDNSANVKDLGWYAKYDDGSAKKVGVYYDASASEFKMASELGAETDGVMAAPDEYAKVHMGEIDCDGAFDASGAANLQSTLAVAGASTLAAASFSGAIDANSSADFQGAVNLQSTIAVAGASTLAGASFSGAIDANSTADFQGAVNLQSTIAVAGASTLAGASFSGAIDANSTSDFQGAMNLQAGITVAGAADYNGAMDVAGATSLAASGVLTDIRGTLSVDEAATFDAGVTIGGALDLNAAADISGATSLAASGVLTDIRGTLSVDEAATFDAGVTIGGAIDANSSSNFQGAMVLQSTLEVGGAVDINAAADISGATSLAASGVLTDIRGTLSVDEAATFDAGVTIGGALDLNAAADISGATSLAASGVLTDIRGTLSVDEAAVFDAAVTMSGAITASGAGDATMDVAADSIYFRDADGTMKREAASDYAASIAGDGLTAASGVLAVDMSELSAADVDVSADSLMFIDATDSSSKKESFADLFAKSSGRVCGDGLQSSGGQLSISWASQRFTKATVDATSGTGSGDAANKIATTSAPLSGSEMVFLNGMLLTAEESSGSAGDYDYAITSAGVITFESEVVDLMDSDDVISVQYIAK
jgi:hypothetical protein